MKKQILLFTAACGITYLTLSSSATGPAQNGHGDRTSRINTGLFCATSGCHTLGTGTTTASIEVRRKAFGASSAPVTDFIQGEDYLITFKGTHPTLAKFGFQLLAVEGAKNGTTQCGTFSNLAASTHSKTVSGIDIIEHSMALSKTGSDYVVNMEWKAPATTSATTMTFCGVINAVDGGGTAFGDVPSALITVTLQNTTSVEQVKGNMHIKAYPNPITSNYLTLEMENVKTGTYTVNAYSVNGAHVYHNELNLTSGKATQPINTERWAAGNYILHIHNGESQKMITVVKQ